MCVLWALGSLRFKGRERRDLPLCSTAVKLDTEQGQKVVAPSRGVETVWLLLSVNLCFCLTLFSLLGEGRKEERREKEIKKAEYVPAP